MPLQSYIRYASYCGALGADRGSAGHRLRRCGGELVGPCPKCGGTNRFAVFGKFNWLDLVSHSNLRARAPAAVLHGKIKKRGSY
jgi:hypothetical protein